MGNSGSYAPEKVKRPILMNRESINYVVQKTDLTNEEAEQYYENFIHNYPDGKIDKRAFRRFMKKGFPEENIEQLEKHIFRIYDANNNGTIEFREFMIILTIMSKGTPQENLEQIFRFFDPNNDGTISKEELYQVVKDLQTLTGNFDCGNCEFQEGTNKALTEKAFEEMDKDGDSKITKEEFIQACLSNEKITSCLALKIIEIFEPDDN